MGIPKFFHWISKKYGKTIEDWDENKTPFGLFIDLNGMIHPVVRGFLAENPQWNQKEKQNNTELNKILYGKILESIQNLIDKIKPSDILYIAIDGVAPFGKIHQQKSRRYKAAYETFIQNKRQLPWDTNMISPGTHFMNGLCSFLHQTIFNLKGCDQIQIFLDDANNVGEGEHKIFEWLRQNMTDEEVWIYGLDADLIMISLLHQFNVKLLREAQIFGKPIEGRYCLLNIDELKNGLYQEITDKTYSFMQYGRDPDVELNLVEFDKQNIIADYVVLCFLLGNDFVPPLSCLGIRYNSIELLIDTYSKYLAIRCQPFTNLKDNFIHRGETRFLGIMQMLYRDEIQRLKDTDKEWRNLRINKNKDTPALQDLPLKRRYFWENMQTCDPDHSWYSPIGFSSNQQIIAKYYMLSLDWILTYYKNGCSNWRFHYPYSRGPLIKEMVLYLLDNPVREQIEWREPLSMIEQTISMMPPSSWTFDKKLKQKILKSKFSYMFPVSFPSDDYLKVWDYESHPILPIIHQNEIMELVETFNIGENVHNEQNKQKGIVQKIGQNYKHKSIDIEVQIVQQDEILQFPEIEDYTFLDNINEYSRTTTD